MIIDHYIGIGQYQWYHIPKAAMDGAYLCMVGDASQHGIPSVEGHAWQSIAIWWCIILCMGPIWMIVNHYSGLGPWQWYHTFETIPDGVNFCMVGDTSQHGDTRCWELHRVVHRYLVMQHTLSGWVMCDAIPFQRSWAMAMTPYTQSLPRRCRFPHCQRCKSRGDSRCWGSFSANHRYPGIKNTFYGSQMHDSTSSQWAWAMSMTPHHTQSHPRLSQLLHGCRRHKSQWGYPGVESHAGKSIAIQWYNILCMSLRWMIINHYSGLGPWHLWKLIQTTE